MSPPPHQVWTALGHAAWRGEVAGLTLLLDPVFSERPHAGCYAMHPPRAVDWEALDDAVIVVTHRHPDHFDPETLGRLARRRPDRLLLTPDPLVAEAGRALGLRWAKVLPADAPVDLGGAVLLPVRSQVAFPEWAPLVHVERDGQRTTVLHEVDAVLGEAAAMPALRDRWARALGLSALALDLHVARWSVGDVVGPSMGTAPASPLRAHRAEVERAAALGAAVVVAGAGGTRRPDDDHWLHAHGWPVSEARFLADLGARRPGVRTSGLVVGRRFEVAPGAVSWSDGHGPVTALAAPDPRAWHPTAVPPVVDRAPGDAHARQAVIDRWLTDELAPAWVRRHGRLGLPDTDVLRLRLDVVHADRTVSRTLRVRRDGADVVPEADPDWDALVEITGSGLHGVLIDDDPWGRVLLDGDLRARRRAWRAGPEGLVELALPAIFLYAARGYDDQHARWVAREVRRWAAGTAG